MEKNKHEKSIFQYSNIIFMSELLEWGRVRDSEVKPSDYFESKEYNAVVERVKDAAVERLRVDAHIASQSCKQTQPK
jgi:HD superfamily phosphohydrolase YqeK